MGAISVQGVLQSDSSKVLKPSQDVIHPSHMVVHLQACLLEGEPDFSSPYNTSKTKQLTPSPAQIQSSHASFNLSSNTKDTLAHSTPDQYQEKFDFNNHNNVK